RAVHDTVDWLADNAPLTSLNFAMASREGIWALRYPTTRDLFWMGEGATQAATGHRALAIATEPLDAAAGWNALQPGELLYAHPDKLKPVISHVADRPPKQLLDPSYRAPGGMP